MILAIECSSLVASVALADETKVFAEYTTNQKKTHSQTILPMIDEIFKITGINKKDIDAVAVSGGPGSFTGLRIGSATAKGIALALNVPIINVSTLEALAYNLQYTDKIICPIMDARRNQVYAGIYENIDGYLKTVVSSCAISVEMLSDRINELNKEIIFIGDGVPVYREELDCRLKCKHYYAPINMDRQRAGSVAALGLKYLSEGKIEDADLHVPEYLRLSQAERERNEHNKTDENK